MIKFAIILLLCLPLNVRGEFSFSIDSCKAYLDSQEFIRLDKYLKKIHTNLKELDLSEYLFYKSKILENSLHKEEQLKILLKGLDHTSDTDLLLKSKYFDELALVYKSNGDGMLDESLNYINKSLEIKLELGNPNEIAKSLIIKGNIYYKAKFRKSYLDTALTYFTKARELNTDEGNHYLILNAINTVWLNQGKKLDSIEINYKEIIEYYRGSKNLKSEANASNSLASFYRKQGRYLESQEIYDTLLAYVKRNKWKKYERPILSSMYKLYESKGDYKTALELKDSLVNIRYNEFRQNLQNAEKEHENEKLKLELAQTEAAQYKNRLWLSILGGTTGTLCIILFGLYKYFALKRQKVEQALEAAQIKAAFDATKAKMEGEQKERESIASVLHDQVASLLTAADLHLNVAKKKDPSAQGINKAVGIIKDINTHVRDLSHQLVSPSLIKFGLEAGLDTLVDKMQSDQTHITYVSTLGSTRYDSSLETFVHQCASEFLQNVMKHSSASQAKLVISEDRGKIVLSVVDNGDNRGVSMKAPTGLGLTHIKARAAALGGSFSFTLNPIGAESVLEVPVVDVLVS